MIHRIDIQRLCTNGRGFFNASLAAGTLLLSACSKPEIATKVEPSAEEDPDPPIIYEPLRLTRTSVDGELTRIEYAGAAALGPSATSQNREREIGEDPIRGTALGSLILPGVDDATEEAFVPLAEDEDGYENRTTPIEPKGSSSSSNSDHE